MIDKMIYKVVKELNDIQTKIIDEEYEVANEEVNNLLNDLQKEFPTEIDDLYLNRFNYAHWDYEEIKELMKSLEKIEFTLLQHEIVDKNIVRAYSEGAIGAYGLEHEFDAPYKNKALYLAKGIIYACNAA